MKNNYNQILDKLKQQHQRNGWEINEQRIRQQAWMLNDRLMNESALNNANASSAAAGGGSGNRRGNNVVVIKSVETMMSLFGLNGTWHYILYDYTDNVVGDVVDTLVDFTTYNIPPRRSGAIQYKGYVITFQNVNDGTYRYLFIDSTGLILLDKITSDGELNTNRNGIILMTDNNDPSGTFYIFNGNNYMEFITSSNNYGSYMTGNKLLFYFFNDNSLSICLLDGVNDPIYIAQGLSNSNIYAIESYSNSYTPIVIYDENTGYYTTLMLVNNTTGEVVNSIDLTSSNYNSYVGRSYGANNFLITFNGTNWFIFEGSSLTQYTSDFNIGYNVLSPNLRYNRSDLLNNNVSDILVTYDSNYRYLIYKFPGEEVRVYDSGRNSYLIMGSVTGKSIGFIIYNNIFGVILSGGVVNTQTIESDQSASLIIISLYDRYFIQNYTSGGNRCIIYNYDGTLLDSILNDNITGDSESGNSIVLISASYSYCMNNSTTNFTAFPIVGSHSGDYNYTHDQYNLKGLANGNLFYYNTWNASFNYITNTSIINSSLNIDPTNFQNGFYVLLSKKYILVDSYQLNSGNYGFTICDYNGNVLESVEGPNWFDRVVGEDKIIYYYTIGNNRHTYVYFNGVLTTSVDYINGQSVITNDIAVNNRFELS